MRTVQFAAVVWAASMAAGCDHNSVGPATGGPVSASVVVAPLPGATGVSRSAPVAVQFGQAVDTASCARRFAVYMGDTTGMALRGRMTWDSTYRHMTFAPDSTMAPGTTYYVLMRDSIMTMGTMMGGGSMGMGGGAQTPGSPMMFNQPPAGAVRTASGMMWSFTTGP